MSELQLSPICEVLCAARLSKFNRSNGIPTMRVFILLENTILVDQSW